jgi:hypothetical protein
MKYVQVTCNTEAYNSYCTVLAVCNPTMTLNVQCWGTWSLLSLLNTNCNVLGYWRHRSICYISLFTTSLVVITISPYNVLWPSDVVSQSGPLISVLLSVRWSTFVMFSLLPLSLLCVCRPSIRVFAPGMEDTLPHDCISLCSGFRTISLLRNS